MNLEMAYYWADEGTLVDLFYLDNSKVFESGSHRTLMPNWKRLALQAMRLSKLEPSVKYSTQLYGPYSSTKSLEATT